MPVTYDYPHMAVTADAVVLTAGEAPKVLLIRRARPPFAGQWALPGGYVDMDERIAGAAARELEEETGLKDVALSFLAYFDAIDRDPRERTLSLAFWGLVPEAARGSAKAADDAAELAWHPLDQLPALAFDHSEILAAAAAAWRSARG